MNLSNQVFAETIDALRRAAGCVAGRTEQRGVTRMALEGTLPATILARGAPARSLTVLLCDLSHKGAGMMVGQPLQAGDQLLVGLPRGSSKTLTVLAEVRYSTQRAEGIHYMGVEFVREVSDADAEALRQGAAQRETERIRESVLSNG